MDAGLDLFVRDVARKKIQDVPVLEKWKQGILNSLGGTLNAGWSPKRAQRWYEAEYKLAVINTRLTELLPHVESFCDHAGVPQFSDGSCEKCNHLIPRNKNGH